LRASAHEKISFVNLPFGDAGTSPASPSIRARSPRYFCFDMPTLGALPSSCAISR
jgi:hypothetical protein